MTQLQAVAAAFDRRAPTYDAFGASVIGRHFREAVRRRMLVRFPEGASILELNCGTGEDAAWLAQRGRRVRATDISPSMLDRARARIGIAGVAGRVEVVPGAIELADEHGMHDGVLSNFGGLNCVESPREVMRRLARCVRRGGFAICCVMGPLVPSEWAWFLARGDVRRAFRRLRRGGVMWNGVRVRYPGIGTLTRAATPWFVWRRAAAVGFLIPPTYAESWADRHPRLVERLAGVERRIEAFGPVPWLADHYLLELERTAAAAEGGEA